VSSNEIQVQYKKVLKSPSFRSAPMRAKLFTYLFENRNRDIDGKTIWTELLEEKKIDYPAGSPRVRERCLDLREALRDYFAHATEGWVFALPPASPEGYRLQCIRCDDPDSAVRSFWKAHLGDRDVAIVYVEQLFYQDWSKYFTFRYYDLNAEQPTQALADLKELYPEWCQDGRHIGAAYPYIACGEIAARDVISDWFLSKVMIQVQNAVTRRMDDAQVLGKSLILLGPAVRNRITGDVLRSREAGRLDICLQENHHIREDGSRCGRLIVKNVTDQEKKRLSRYKPEDHASDYVIDFSPDRGHDLVIVTRVHHGDAPVTIIDSDFGRSIEQVARYLCDEQRMMTLLKEAWAHVPETFQILLAVHIDSLSMDHRPAKVVPLVWRSFDQDHQP
jgi:hypothetical protein